MKKLSTKAQSVSFNIFRWIAILALTCSIILTIVLWVESTVPTEESAKQSDSVADSIKDKIDVVENNETDVLSIRFKGHKDAYYCVGDREQLEVVFLPSNTVSKDLTYEVVDESVCSIDDDGMITYKEYGSTYIRVTSTKNPDANMDVLVQCSGYHADDTITDLTSCTSKDALSTECASIDAGCAWTPIFKDQNGRIISVGDLTITSSNDDVLQVHDNVFYGILDGDVVLHVECEKASLSKDFSFSVLHTGITAPTQYVFKEDVVYVIRTKPFYPEKNIDYALPDGAMAGMFYYSIEDSSIALESGLYIYPVKLGQTTVTLTPYANPSAHYSFTIVVTEEVPVQIKIEGKQRAIAGGKAYYRANYVSSDGFVSQMDAVQWEVDGKNASINEKGVLVANRLGNVVIRARSTVDPSVYCEFTVKVSLWDSFNLFIRKIIGHFGAFAVLGVGLAVSLFLLLRPRALYAPCALLTGFLCATMSEVFQLPLFVPDRAASWLDVMIDTCGVATGIAIASLIISIYMLIIKFASKSQYEKVKRTLGVLSFSTFLMPQRKIKMVCDTNEYKQNC